MTIRELTNELHYACEIAGHDADEEIQVYVGEWGERLYPLGSLDSDSKIVALQPALGLDDELRAEIKRLRASADRVLEHLALGEDVPVDAYEDLRALVENAP